MKQSEAWLLQIQSDFEAAEFLFKKAAMQPHLRCQVMAKYQQVAEKSVKAMVAAVNDLGTANFMTVTGDHVPVKEIDALTGLRRLIDNKSAEYLRNEVFTDNINKQIIALCQMAPHYPGKGEPFSKNTEYPFNPSVTDMSDWTAPSAPDIFTAKELQDTHDLIWVLWGHSKQFISAVQRGRSKT